MPDWRNGIPFETDAEAAARYNAEQRAGRNHFLFRVVLPLLLIVFLLVGGGFYGHAHHWLWWGCTVDQPDSSTMLYIQFDPQPGRAPILLGTQTQQGLAVYGMTKEGKAVLVIPDPGSIKNSLYHPATDGITTVQAYAVSASIYSIGDVGDYLVQELGNRGYPAPTYRLPAFGAALNHPCLADKGYIKLLYPDGTPAN